MRRCANKKRNVGEKLLKCVMLYFVVNYIDSRELTYHINKDFLLIEYRGNKTKSPLILPRLVLIDFNDSLEYRVMEDGTISSTHFNIEDQVRLEAKKKSEIVESYFEGEDYITISKVIYDFHTINVRAENSDYTIEKRYEKIEPLNNFVKDPKYLRLLTLIEAENDIGDNLVCVEASSIYNGEKKKNIHVKEWGVKNVPLDKIDSILTLFP